MTKQNRETTDENTEDTPRNRGDRHRDDSERGRRGGGRGHRGGDGFEGRGSGPRRGGPRGRGRRQRRGDVRAALLLLIAEQPRHGYELMQAIAERSGGQWEPSPGSIYPALSALQDEGLIQMEADESNRSVAHLTDAGEKYLAEHGASLENLWDSLRGNEGRDLMRAVHGIGGAARQVGEVGSEQQIAAAVALLTNTQRELYAILAADPAEFTA